MAETMFKTAQELLDQRRKNTQDNLLTIKAIEGKQRERPLSGYAKFGGMLGEAAGESLKDYLGVKDEGDYLRDYESGIEQRGVMEQNLGAEGSEYSPEVAAQVLAQQDRFIEESGGNLTPEIKRASDFTRTMKGLTPEQLNDPMQVAKVYNDFGYTNEAVDLLRGSRMTPYQQAQIQVAQDAQAVANKQAGQEVEKKRIVSSVQQRVMERIDPAKNPIEFNQAMFNELSANPLTAGLAKTYQDNLLKIGNDNMQRKADAANKSYTPPNANVLKMVSAGTVNDPSVKDLSDNDLMKYNLFISSRTTELLKGNPLDQALSMARQEAQAGVNKGKEGWFLDDDDTFTSPRKKGSGDWSIEEAK